MLIPMLVWTRDKIENAIHPLYLPFLVYKLEVICHQVLRHSSFDKLSCDMWNIQFLYYFIVSGTPVLQKRWGLFCLISDVITPEFTQLLQKTTPQRGCGRLGTPQKHTLRTSTSQLKSPARHWSKFNSHMETEVAITLKQNSRAEISLPVITKMLQLQLFQSSHSFTAAHRAHDPTPLLLFVTLTG